MIAIIDYGMGNLRSVQKALECVGAEACITSDPKVVANAGKVVLPGVGAIAPAMDKLNELNMLDEIYRSIKSGKPFLGICVGFQLLFDASEEGGDVEALKVIGGNVKRFTDLKVPQMGWNEIDIKNNASMFKGISDGAHVYFCHSYYAMPSSTDVIASTTNYGVTYTSAIQQDNVWGVQFHPEKSQAIGLKILENFVKQ